ncbi:MAG TPA: carbamoyltransferase C-terminal domain-containing protein [Polyangiaceae bacterium]|nr:carbamoyltransferase C-terminal domain-containing protein [Polyangiaceae bacterium]
MQLWLIGAECTRPPSYSTSICALAVTELLRDSLDGCQWSLAASLSVSPQEANTDMYILGLATMEESAAVLMCDGRVVAAAEEERFSRRKHHCGFPYESIEFVLGAGGVSLAEVDEVAVYWDRLRFGPRVQCGLSTTLRSLRSPSLISTKLRRWAEVWRGSAGPESGWSSLFHTRRTLRRRFGRSPRRIRYFDHHRCHMASTYFASDFEQSAILIMDGAGEAACTTWARGDGLALSRLDEHRVPHSLGHFYSAVTGYLGFAMLDGEYKLMGLSPYGEPSYVGWIEQNFLRRLGGGRYALVNDALDYHRALTGRFEGAFSDRFGPPRRGDDDEVTDRDRDIAASAQLAFERTVLEMTRELRRRTGLDRIALAGGCALNSVANGRVLRDGDYAQVYVPPVPHDSGGALGAAMLCHVELTHRRPEPLHHALFGSQFGDRAVEAALAFHPNELEAEKLSEDELIARCARALADGSVVAWFQGAMEFGPRALGSRSILADPRRDGMRDVLNAVVKKREPFRPFAPAVKAERASEFFELSQPSPFMSLVVPVRAEKRAQLAAVTHVDGTARPQTVDLQTCPKFWKLLDEFERLTGVPVLLNTSFNIQEPIVRTPEQALRTYLVSGIHALALGSHWVTRADAVRAEGRA